ncbi:MAG: transglycosylase domain-containing protein [Oscillospiraceae bacterium]|nr:transglycosylase domain-containing protein [Oscillospiraceae bacterium]
MKQEVIKASGNAVRKIESVLGVVLKIIGTVFLIILTTGSILAVVFSIYITRFLSVDMNVNLSDYTLKQTSTVMYRDRETGESRELDTLHGQQNRKLAVYEEIPQFMIDALVAVEDKRFFQHKGVDWKRSGGALLNMFMPGGDSYGGSTVTQQLIKNLTDEKDFTVARKVQEILRALDFEKSYTKEEILEWYLNTCYFGQGCYGVKTAAEVYFGKELKDITAAEAACIIGITNKPTLYNPYLNPDKNKGRQETILKEMYEQNKLTEIEYRRAVNQKLEFVGIGDENDEYDLGRVQSWFMDQVAFDVRDDLIEQKGVSLQYANMLIYSGGLTIEATIDMRIQNIIDEIYADEENFPIVKNEEKPQSSLMVIDPYTGEILGFAGKRGVKTGNLIFNLPNHSQRQPGSSIKPITVYAAAFEMGLITPYSVVDDAPSENAGKAWPRNSGGAYRGRTNVITAVQNSVNTIAVRVVEMMTPAKAFYFGRDTMGMTSLVEERWYTKADGSQYKMSDIDRSPLALGGLTKGLTVRELTAAYATFVNKGMYSKPHTYTKVFDANGALLLDNVSPPDVVIKEKTAYYMNTVLQQVVTAGTGSRAKLNTTMATAGKTGTTTDDCDRWFVGYTPYYACGSWFGYNIPKKITLQQSTNPALAMWKLVMDEIHEGLEPREFFKPEGLVGASYCLDSGLVPTDNCRLDPRGSRVSPTLGVYYPEDVPKATCNVHTLVNVCKESGKLATPYCPEENHTRVALLNIGRGMAVPGVSVGDEQYVVRYWGGGGPTIPEDTFLPAASGTDGALPYNTFCPIHELPGDYSTPSSIDDDGHPLPDDALFPNMPGHEPGAEPPHEPEPEDPSVDPNFIPQD